MSPRLTRPKEGDTKRRRVEEHLSRLDADQLGVATGSSIVAALAEQGVAIPDRYARELLEQWRFDHGIPTPGERRR